MNKQELVTAVAQASSITKKDTEAVLDALVKVITEGLKEDDKINLSGLGIFETKIRAERKARNPVTGEEIVIKEQKAVAFKASKTLKDEIK